MPKNYLLPLDAVVSRPDIGSKATNLLWLAKSGFQVPQTWICTAEVKNVFTNGREAEREQFERELTAAIPANGTYAIRSSANLEDGRLHSFAGQFTTLLDVDSRQGVLHAIQEVFDSGRSDAAAAYLNQVKAPLEQVEMSVLLQEMVEPRVSGVAFSRNPLTGFAEVVIEALPGSGEALLQSGATPDRWIYKWGEWIETPKASKIEPGLIDEVLQQARSIESRYGHPVDLEWVFDGTSISWVQLRRITHIDNIPIYSNRIAKEVLPGLIKPLVWSVNVPLVNGAWVDLFTEVIGRNDIDPESLARSFHYRAYFNMAAIGRVFRALAMPEESLELLVGFEGGSDKPTFRPSIKTTRHLPRMLRFLWDKLRFSRKVEPVLERGKSAFTASDRNDMESISDSVLIDRLDRHYVAMREVTYMNIVVPVLLQVYEGLLRRMLKSRGIAIEMLDFTEGQSDFANYDPNIHLEALHRQFEALAPELQRQVLNGGSDASPAVDGLAELQLSVDAFMEQFGHLADSGNDFSCPRWSENREMILNLIADYTEPEMVSERSTWAELPLGRLDKLWLGWIYRRARQFRLYREGVSSLYTYAHAELRKYWLEIGARLVKRELIDHAQDVFLLKEPDIREAMTVSDSQSKLRKHIADRKQAMERAKEFVLPEVIFGDEMPPPETLDHSMDTLHGIPTARGYYTGTARVIRGIREFDRLTPGEVLVVPFSDVGWTPLFSKAGAVIAESGGMLSHSSIVAREYGLPAVVSVSSACDLLEGKQVTVDGYKGEVRVHREGS